MKQRCFSLHLAALCLLLSALRASATVYYVNANNAAPVAPFASWTTAATNIQDAINLTSGGDTVLVTNGIYGFGGLAMAGTLTNRVALTNAITVQSVNGPWVTTILGAGATNGAAAVRCAWLTNGATLVGFTLTGGATQTSGGTTTLESGGGAWCATSNALVSNCVIVSNAAYYYGGAVYQGTVQNSLISSNVTYYIANGASYQSVLINCTVVSNAAYGVVSPLAMTNCIIYFNGLNGAQNYSVSGSAFSHCCTTPALSGTTNFTSVPQLFADGVHLATNSPCIGAGLSLAVVGTDIFGNAWSNPPAVGCAEWYPAPAITSQPATQFPATGGVAVGVDIAGQPPFSCWWTLNGMPLQNNGHYSSANTTALLINNVNLGDAGAYQVVVSNSFGMATSAVSQVTIHCVAGGGMEVPPYTSWATAATNIQDAINVALAGDIVLVTNGTYSFGGLVMQGNLTNRVALTQPIMVQSVNGPWVTTIQGGNVTYGNAAVRCGWLTNGAALVGFALTGGATRAAGDLYGLESGGGVWCISSNALVANCLICSNAADYYGGGVYQGTLRNCDFYANSAGYGGGSYLACLLNCTMTANSAAYQYGGADRGSFTNCIIYNNSGGNYASSAGQVSYCCTYPLPSGGIGNFTNPPQLFADNVHLLTNSPCIGVGTNLGSSTDINGWPWNNPPSIGCSEAPTFPIIAQPVLQLTNNPIGLFVTAAFTCAGPISCWWLQNGVPLQNNGNFSSAQTANLIVAGVSFADAGSYQLVVSNTFGVVTSAVVQLVIHCVNVAGANPIAPYATWATAATNIQDAIAASSAADVVLVTNGLYATGGKSIDGLITNRVSLDKAILLQGVNGAKVTIIQGAWDPTSTNGPGAVRCAWMTNNAILCGFTLLGGATRATASSVQALIGGGVYGASTNGTPSATVASCAIVGNAAANMGGGAYQVLLNYCTIATNLVIFGSASGAGGGAELCNLLNCSVAFNTANAASGGGVSSCNLTNCTLFGNSSYFNGGAANGGTLVNCTVTANTTSGFGYGAAVYEASLYNCILFSNFSKTYESDSNYASCGFAYCCASPLPAGTGNMDVNPQLLADGIHLAATSPCIGAGTASAVSGTDIDGQPWNSPPSIGCDEWWPAPVIAVQPCFQFNSTTRSLNCNVVVAGQTPFAYFWSKNGVPIQDDGHYTNSGTASLIVNDFDFGDAGSYQVVVTNSSGAVTSAVAQVAIHAVNAAGTNPMPPFSSWATAATSIQDAINSAGVGDIVLVTNGLYATGGLVMSGNLTNRVALNKALTVMSVNGYAATLIQGVWDPTATNGPGAVRCAYLADGAVLIGFTLQNGATRATGDVYSGGPLESGGGILCNSIQGVIFNCVLTNNSAIYGGGVTSGTLNNSLVYGNQASYGGGAYYGTLNNCTVVNNYASLDGGGTYATSCGNSIIVGNYLQSGVAMVLNNCVPFGIYAYSCSSPTLAGVGNINVNPQFLDYFHIAATSPCRGAGSPQFASGTDLDGETWTNPPSMGCDEVIPADLIGPLTVNLVASPTNLLVNRYTFYSGYFTGRASTTGWSFGDGTTATNSWTGDHEWTNSGDYPVAFTVYNNDHPTGVAANVVIHVQALAVPQLQSFGLLTNGFQFQFSGQTNANYTVQYSTNLTPPVAWQTLQTINLNSRNVIQVVDDSWTNTSRFYRVLVQ